MSAVDQDFQQPTSFAFTDEMMARAKAFIAKYPEGRQRSATMPLLDLAQRQEGWVSKAAMDTIAEMLDIPPIRVYEVATFYTMYKLKPVGKHHVEVCTNVACMLRGSDEIVGACKEHLGINVGETTADGQFSLAEAECLGACVNAPMIQIGDHYYEDLDKDSMKAIIDTLKRGEAPKPGSQIGRQTSAPAGGLTSLNTEGFKPEGDS
jgi:NADH-quinone oxidoreductase E subunit